MLAEEEGWALRNEHAWRRDFPKFAGFFWRQVFTGLGYPADEPVVVVTVGGSGVGADLLSKVMVTG